MINIIARVISYIIYYTFYKKYFTKKNIKEEEINIKEDYFEWDNKFYKNKPVAIDYNNATKYWYKIEKPYRMNGDKFWYQKSPNENGKVTIPRMYLAAQDSCECFESSEDTKVFYSYIEE